MKTTRNSLYKGNGEMPPILPLAEPDFWGRVRKLGAVVQPLDIDPDASVHCMVAGDKISLAQASRQQGDALDCFDCKHRRPCGRLRMNSSNGATFN